MTSTNTPLAILQISDSHLLATPEQKMLGIATEKYFLDVLKQAFAEQYYDLVLFSGDLAQMPSLPTYERLQRSLAEYAVPVVCLPGNHDDLTLMRQVFSGVNISCRQQLLFEYWQIICLNSQIVGKAGGCLQKQEIELLQHYLQQNPQYNTLIATHHHCIPTQSHWMDTMMIENSAEFLDLLRCYPQVKAITTGHIHQELSAEVNQLKIFGNPSTCFQFTPYSHNFAMDTTPPGYRQFFLHPDGRVETQVHRLPTVLSELIWDENGYFDGP